MGVDEVARALHSRILIVLLLAGCVALVAVAAVLVTAMTPTTPFGSNPQPASGMDEAWHYGVKAEARMAGMTNLAHQPGDCHPAGQPYLGITYLPLSEVAARIYSLGTSQGVLITAVDANSPAAKAGLRPNDVIVEFGGVPISPSDSLISLQMRYRSGDSVSLTIVRQNERRSVNVTLAAMDLN